MTLVQTHNVEKREIHYHAIFFVKSIFNQILCIFHSLAHTLCKLHNFTVIMFSPKLQKFTVTLFGQKVCECRESNDFTKEVTKKLISRGKIVEREFLVHSSQYKYSSNLFPRLFRKKSVKSSLLEMNYKSSSCFHEIFLNCEKISRFSTQ